MLKLGAATVAMAQLPVLALATGADDILELRATKKLHRLAGDQYAASELWLYNGETPGPEIRVKQGERVRVRFINELEEPTSIHWHGIRISNAMDGVSGLTQDAVQPGEAFLYDFVAPDAGTFWYHAHNKSWEEVARGLYGALIVEEAEPVFDRNHDLTLVIDDWRVGDDGALHVASIGTFMDWSHAGRLGNWLTVNGKSQPELKLNAGENYRLRLINASNARVLQISPKALGAEVLGFDGFVFAKPEPSKEEYISLAPAQRMDLIVNQPSQGERKLNDIGDFALQVLSGNDPISIAKLTFVEPTLHQAPAVLAFQPNVVPEPDLQNAVHIPMVMTGGAMGGGSIIYNGKELGRREVMQTKQVWAFNGVANLAEEPLFRIRRGQTVTIKTENQTGWMHGMHVHGHHFKVMKPDFDHWRDTFVIDRDETVEIAFVADNPGKWLFHCHMLEHAAAGMRTWFEVV